VLDEYAVLREYEVKFRKSQAAGDAIFAKEVTIGSFGEVEDALRGGDAWDGRFK
jgi:hypothetical protein